MSRLCFPPDYKNQAVDIYKKWLKKGPLTPKELSTSSTIEKISGVYVPFWLYSYSARSQMNAHANKVRTTRKGDTEYTYTDHFDVYRDVRAQFNRIPADASEKMPDKEMDMLEPYNYEDIENFAMPYLSGYLSERFNYINHINNRPPIIVIIRVITNIATPYIAAFAPLIGLSATILPV